MKTIVKTKKSLTVPVFRFVLEIIFSLAIDIGAVLWLITLVTKYRYFNYALLVLVCIAVLLITSLYFCFDRAPKVFQEFQRIVSFFRKISVVLFWAFLFIVLNIIVLTVGNSLPYRAEIAHCAYYIFSEYFRDCQGEALEAINETISYDDRNAEYYVERGKLLIEIYDKLVEDTIVVSATNKQISYTEGDCLRNAISDYTTAILLKPDNIEYVFERGKIYAKRGKNYSDEALADFKAAVDKEGENPDYCFEYAKELIDYGNGSAEKYQEAQDYLEKAANSATGDNKAEYYQYYGKALQNIEEEQFRSEGLSAYIKSISISDQDKANEVTTELGNYLKEHREMADEMIKNLKSELNEDNFNVNLWYECGYLLNAAQRYDEALEYLNKVIEREPLYFEAYVQRSLVNNHLKNYEDSVNDISIMLHHKEITEYYVYRADYYYNAQEYNEAIEDYILAAQNGSKKSAYCYYSCGQSYYRLEDYTNAASYYDKAIPEGLSDRYKASCYKECGDVYYNLASKEYQDENIERRNEYYKTAIERYYEALNWETTDSIQAHCYYWAGMAHSRLGDDKKALSDYEAACKLDDEDNYKSQRDECRERLKLME